MRARVLFLLVWLSALPARADDVGDASALFREGVQRFDRKDYAGALDDFEKSSKLVPSRSVRENIAACLAGLHRYEEALGEYEKLGEAGEVARLRRFTGFVRVHGQPPGARVFVDGVPRAPSDAPLRVTVGTRRVRVEKEGFGPFETTVTVASGETVDVPVSLGVVVETGRLRVVEASGKPLDVRVDGVAVGRTPWEGSVSAGEHTVALAGGRDFGAPPRAVRVVTGKTERVELAAGPLPAELRVEPTPTNAVVSVDGAVVSKGTWASSLPSGRHVVEVTAPWHEPRRTDVALGSEEPREIRVALDPVRRVSIELFGGPTVLPAYESAVRACASCTGYFLGGRAGYRLTRAFGLEIFFVPTMTVANSAPEAPGSSYTLDAGTSLSFGGFSAKLELLDRTPITLRFWAGFGSTYAGGVSSWSLVTGPEIRIGYRLSRTLVVDAGASLFVFGVPATGEVTATDGTVAPLTSGGLGVVVPLSVALRAEL
jgi:hypothetical protein